MKTDKTLVTTSKFLSLVLHHQSEVVRMQLDDEGWLAIEELIVNAKQRGHALTLGSVRKGGADPLEAKRFFRHNEPRRRGAGPYSKIA